jgi:hypothetical protein
MNLYGKTPNQDSGMAMKISPPNRDGRSDVTVSSVGITTVTEMDFEQALFTLLNLKLIDSKVEKKR